jgi:hypothetical protein
MSASLQATIAAIQDTPIKPVGDTTHTATPASAPSTSF